MVYCCRTCRGQRTTSNNLSPSMMWALEMELGLSGLAASLCQLSHLPQTFLPTILLCPAFLFSGFRLPSTMLSLSVGVPKRLETSIVFNKLELAPILLFGSPAACLVPSMTFVCVITFSTHRRGPSKALPSSNLLPILYRLPIMSFGERRGHRTSHSSYGPLSLVEGFCLLLRPHLFPVV